MISLHYTSHTKAYNTIYTACNIVEAIYSFTNITVYYKVMYSKAIACDGSFNGHYYKFSVSCECTDGRILKFCQHLLK